MPYTGYDPFGPQDPSGGGIDPSLYYALSPGGRFPGDTQNYLEYLAAQSRGTAGGNPDYDIPDWMTRLGRIGRLLGSHERNVQQGGEGQAPSDVGGYPYQFWSGPGASYGPPGGPLHGLVDQGRMGDPWDGPDRPEGGSPPSKPHHGGGGKGTPNFGATWQPYQGMQHQSSFVDWQPTQSFSGSSGPTRFVQGQGSTSMPARPQSMPPLGNGGRHGHGGGSGGGGGSAGGGHRGGAGNGGAGGGKNNKPPDDVAGFLDWLAGSRGQPNRWGAAPGPGLRDDIRGGVDVNNIDRGTPGWQEDPTTGTWDTRGMPNATPTGPEPGESFDHYLTRLHDSGLGADAIGGLIGPNGFHQNENGDWEQGWGTGPVIRGTGGYEFANAAGGRAGLGGGGLGGLSPNAGDIISGGVFHVPAM
jgi:hypothetical protein